MKIFLWAREGSIKAIEVRTYAQRRELFNQIADIVRGFNDERLTSTIPADVPDNKLIANTKKLLSLAGSWPNTDFDIGTGFTNTVDLSEEQH